jgi:hypothetical protein
MSVARIHMYTYAAKFWDRSIAQGAHTVAPVQTLHVTIRNLLVPCIYIQCTCTVSSVSSKDADSLLKFPSASRFTITCGGTWEAQWSVRERESEREPSGGSG